MHAMDAAETILESVCKANATASILAIEILCSMTDNTPLLQRNGRSKESTKLA